tara:strand:- start:1470 stop:1748 length:279 start_codon:yes stop_codon:yes gene_type:complete
MNNMNIETMQKAVELFDCLPNFRNFAFSREGIKDVILDDDNEIQEVTFSTGYLRRITARVYREEPSYNDHATWILGYGKHISAVFVEVKIIE